MLNEKNTEVLSDRLTPLLSEVFGYFSLLYTVHAEELIQDKILIQNQVTLVDEKFKLNQRPVEKNENNQTKNKQSKTNTNTNTKIQCKFEELPISPDSIDLMFLPGILQESLSPHQILREAERVLIPDGTIVLLINNPIGLTSLKKGFQNSLEKLISFSKLNNRKDHKSENQVWYVLGKHRLKDWLSLLGIETIHQIAVCPEYVTHAKNSSPALFFKNKIKQFFHQVFADQIIIVGKKKVSTLTPIRASWRNNKRFSRPRFAEPSVQQHAETCLTQITK